MHRRLYRLLLWVAVIGLMALIFAFSAQEGPESDGMTQAAVMPLAELLAEVSQGGTDAAEAIYVIIGTMVRKAAHVLEYGLLSLLVLLLLRAYGVRRRWLAIAIALAYAVSDELHQAFVPGRLGTPVDVIIDAIGVIAGVFVPDIFKVWNMNRRKKHVHHS
ncbi:MAG: VanZ family protein [Clostridia bacterium]|nr:VanZ family protein [Clostridia bacterium]